MKEENQKTDKPKYVYLDKFQRYVLRTNKMLEDLEFNQGEQYKQIKSMLHTIRVLKFALYSTLILLASVTLFMLIY